MVQDDDLAARMEYHRRFDEENTEITTALANEAPAEVQPVLLNYNVNKSHDEYKKEVTRDHSKETLLKTADFLRVKPKTTHFNSIAKAILLGIQNFHHELCQHCKKYYAVAYHSTPSLICQACGQGAHDACYGGCKLPGIEWYCSSHNTNGIPAEGDLDETPPQTPPKDQRKADIAEELETKDNENDDEKEEHSDDNRPMCKFFLGSRCKHGISGKECKFQHKKVCRKFLNHGRHKYYGCNKEQNCDYFHVKMCWSSLNQRVCARQDCRFHHIKGTKRAEDNHSNHEHEVRRSTENTNPAVNHPNQHSRNPNAWNTPSENPFLEITKKLSAQMEEMQQQQNFILSKLQMTSTQQTQPPQQHVPPNLLLPTHVHRAEPACMPDTQPSQNQMQQIPVQSQTITQQPLQPQGVQQIYYVPH